MFQHHDPLAVKIQRIASVLILLFFFVPMIGCSTVTSIEKSTKRMVRDFRAPNSDLRKRIGIAFFNNKTTLPEKDIGNKFTEDLAAVITSSCPSILLVKPGDPDYPDDLENIPKTTSGRIDNLALARAGRQIGLNAIVTGTLLDVTQDQRKQGLLWLKDTHYFVQSRIATEVYDTETGAKLLDESFMHEIEIGEVDLDSTQESGEVNTLVVTEGFKNVADEMGEKICNAIIFQPWKGFITSIDADKIHLNFGGKIGLKAGDLFDVFNSDSIFEGLEGRRFFVPGLKTGEIKITVVHPDTAEAVLVSGRDIRKGFCIRPKK